MKKKKRKYTKHFGEFLATNKTAKEYKSDTTFIQALYRKNKKFIQSKGVSYSQFKERMLSIMEYDKLSRKDAATAYSRTRVFLSKEEIGLQNIKQSMDKQTSSEIRKKTGNYKKGFDWEDFKWDKNKKLWVYKSGQFGLEYSYPDDSKAESIVRVVDIYEDDD